MYGYVDEQGNPMNMGGGQPRFFVVGDPRGSGFQPQQQAQEAQLTPQQHHELHLVRLRNMHSAARQGEMKIFLDGLDEIRQALAQFKIGEGDTGNTGRPPIDQAFHEQNIDRLQGAYLCLTERMVNYVDHMMEKQLQIPITNELKKTKDESVQK